MIYATWYGGSSYAQSEIPADVESFPSIAAAKAALRSRHQYGYSYRQDFSYVNRPGQSVYCPAVGDDSELWIYFVDPSDSDDPYPDRIIRFGPRGGVRVEHA